MSNKAQQQTGQEAYEETSRNKNLTRAKDINRTRKDVKKEDLQERLEKLSQISPMRCIYRVPKRFRKINAKAYTPQVVSIGPLHHGKKGLLAMEEHKLRYLRDFLDQTKKGVDYYVTVVKELEERARNCYAETIKFESDEFVEMILVDGVFIIELFLRWSDNELRNETDQIFYKPQMIWDLRHDILLLENQLPFFLLESLFNLAFGGGDHLSFIKLSHNFFNFITLKNEVPNRTNNNVVKHFVDFLRNYYLPSSSPSVILSQEGNIGFRRSATELHKAGFKFQMIDTTSNSLLDLQLTNGVLKIPQLRIEDGTESILRNLLAFEQCHQDDYKNKYISDYIYLMDGLVHTPQDLELLAEKEIIDNCVDNNINVSTLFNDLGKGVVLNDGTFYYSGICEALNEYHKVTWHAWWASLKHDYFGTPWRAASTSAAIFLLVLTLIQTICSLISIN